MRLSTKGRYAVTAMIDLALHQEESQLVSLAEISEVQGISLSYLEQLFARLRRYDIVKGVRGPGGGYRLARPASDISIADIINAVDEKLDATRCAGHENCQDGRKCITHELWFDLSQRIYGFLHNVSLQEVVSSAEVKRLCREQDQRIHFRKLSQVDKQADKANTMETSAMEKP
ncbi:Rrf2 family transcriptional regulator [Ostreibacterium oceani]|uniref:Rrf2 family transcriptional regulator n=1 Tax=Ostreibacterium oceani TaxID=2654998 RepID=A0A6N7EYH2_9GAMM|nr:Rrf2 family transcriptional regulator [Ostreibacterium oceani]MPV85528.1 Rrf2 family transcriptional regulator [Ostreibacterium oceani]